MTTQHSTASPDRAIRALIIGDEILSGKRQDGHFAQLRTLLAARGLKLSEVQYVGDDRARLTEALRVSFRSNDVVFSFGGIGATPDDHTRQAAAAALGLPLVLHPLARQRISERCAEMAANGKGSADMTTPDNLLRLRMGEFPEGAEIVENPFNRIPGFSIRQHYFLPGFPVMAWPMAEAILDGAVGTSLTASAHTDTDRSVQVFGVMESSVIPLMEQLGAQWPGVGVYSLPTVGDDLQSAHIEMGVKGPPELVQPAYAALLQGLRDLGGRLERIHVAS